MKLRRVQSAIYMFFALFAVSVSLFFFQDSANIAATEPRTELQKLTVYQSDTGPQLLFYPRNPAPGDFFILEAGPLYSAEPFELEFDFPGFISDYYQASGNLYVIIAIAFDAEPGQYLISVLAGEEEPELLNMAETITIAPKDFPLSRFSMPPGTTTGWTAARLAEDREKVRLAREETSSYPLWTQPFIWPLDARVSSEFGAIRIINENPPRRHGGIDLADEEGVLIVSVNSGIVRLSEFLLSGGNTVIIDHGIGLSCTYMHLDEIFVEEGQEVKRGDIVGTVGQTGYATGPHLHFEVNIGQVPVNPLQLLDNDLLFIAPAYMRQ